VDELAANIPRGTWTETARALPPSDLPAGAELDARLAELGLHPEDAAELPTRLAEIRADPSLRWIAARFVTAMKQDAGRIELPSPYDDPRRAWPLLPLSLGPAARCVYLPGFLASADQARASLRGRGVPEDAARATLADLGRHVAIHRRAFGQLGLETHWWEMLVWSGALVDVGRLQAERVDGRTVSLHIPETGPFTPEAIDASLDRIRAEWAGWFGQRPERAECESWLLDPHLAEVLPATSNIVRFQQRFTLVDGGYADDQNPLFFVFRRRDVPLPEGLAELPRETSLQRAIVEHLENGGHWTVRKGWLAL
jgi:GNAT domain-containint protein/N-acyltransferase family protein